jgi:hypothetical protein
MQVLILRGQPSGPRSPAGTFAYLALIGEPPTTQRDVSRRKRCRCDGSDTDRRLRRTGYFLLFSRSSFLMSFFLSFFFSTNRAHLLQVDRGAQGRAAAGSSGTGTPHRIHSVRARALRYLRRVKVTRAPTQGQSKDEVRLL